MNPHALKLTRCPNCGNYPRAYFHINGWNIGCRCREAMTPCKNLADAAWYWEHGIPKKHRKGQHR